MRKVFLYLYPTENNAIRAINAEFDEFLTLTELREKYEDFDLMNETIDKRYRQKGYEIYYLLVRGSKIYGLEQKEDDKIIYVESDFIGDSILDNKPDDVLNELGEVDELIVGGYNSQYSVKHVADLAYSNGIDTLIDLDLTEKFFGLSENKRYFNVEEYNPIRFKEDVEAIREDTSEYYKRQFYDIYSSPAFGFVGKRAKKPKTKTIGSKASKKRR